MKLGFILGSTVAFLALACAKPTKPVQTETPTCIQEKIQSFQNQSCNRGAYVYEYIHNGQTVFVFNPGYCQVDVGATVYSANCEVLGQLGGVTGNTLIEGADFTSAVKVSSHWQKN